MRPAWLVSAAFVAAVFGVTAVGCGGGGAGEASGDTSGGGASTSGEVDPSGTVLTAEEIAEGAAWDDAGTQENGELAESDDDGDLTDDPIGDETDEFDALPLAPADGSDGLADSTGDDDAAGDAGDAGGGLTTSGDLGLSIGALVKSSGAIVCTPPGPIRAAACYAHGQYRGQIRVVSMDSKIVEVGVSCAVLNGKKLAKAAGRTLLVNSGWRSVASQRVLYQKYKAGRGPVAAPPGTSHHNCGHAIDFAGSALGSGWLKAHSTSFGFHFIPIKGETWHFEDWTVGPAGVK
jgi:D-alanyl-D-alanine carboxypeptidase